MMLNIEKIKNYIQSANINFLIGSGLSDPYLSTLGPIENWLSELNKKEENDLYYVIRASIYKEYYDKVIYPNSFDYIELQTMFGGDESDNFEKVSKNYSTFLNCWNEIVARRYSNLLNKQLNIFSTNIDMFVESAAEKSRIEFNDGFSGVMNPKFDEGNFNKSYSKTSSYFQNTSEIPVFNLLKLHGSVNWKPTKLNINEICCDILLSCIEDTKKAIDSINESNFIVIDKEDTIDSLEKKGTDFLLNNDAFSQSIYADFEKQYSKFIIVNPTKSKFKETVIDLHFYELMRLYSNALEKENSLLFVQGFSFSDEHISKITIRAAETNPTLLIIIFSYEDNEVDKLKKNLHIDKIGPKNNNIWIVTPTDFVKENSKNKDQEYSDELKQKFQKFDFHTINEVYKMIGLLIPIRSYGK